MTMVRTLVVYDVSRMSLLFGYYQALMAPTIFSNNEDVP
jgi:hypothetical protein